MKLFKSRNYIVIKNKLDLIKAKNCDLCRFIIMEDNNIIYIWKRYNNKWEKFRYVLFDKENEKDFETTGLKAYQNFYYYCGSEEVEKMKHILRPINIWESDEQLHYANFEYSNLKIYKNIYEFDANSAFTYGTLQLPKGFDKLKEYMLFLYENKENSTNKITRSKYKNLQNYLIGYFARIKDFISTRSEIIRESNKNILLRMSEINKNKGIVYLSNTDSIVTDDIGNEVMQKHIGKDVGKFKLVKKVNRLYYKSCNIYQLGNDIKYSGVGYFARKHTDFFNDIYATQSGSLIEGFDFEIESSEKEYIKLCKVRFSEIQVSIVNPIGELLKTEYYRAGV